MKANPAYWLYDTLSTLSNGSTLATGKQSAPNLISSHYFDHANLAKINFIWSRVFRGHYPHRTTHGTASPRMVAAHEKLVDYQIIFYFPTSWKCKAML